MKTLALLVLLAAASPLVAQETTPAPPAAPVPCDPYATPCWTVEKWLIGFRIWNRSEATNYAGARGQLEVRFKDWRFAARGDGTAMAGQMPATGTSFDLTTVRDVEAYGAVSYDLLRMPGRITVGPMIAGGGAFALPQDGQNPSLPRSYTLVGGLTAAFPGGRLHLGGGWVAPYDRGVGFIGQWQIPMTDRIANIGEVRGGRLLVAETCKPGPTPDVPPACVAAHSLAELYIWTGVAIRF